MRSQAKSTRSAFLAGEKVDLTVPDESAIEGDGWAHWFNDKQVTKHLVGHGLFPNTQAKQLKFLEGLATQERLALLIYAKDIRRIVGTISLSNIDFKTRSAEVALVFGVTPRRRNLYALEAMAIITEHGFETLGLWRIEAHQVYPDLSSWNKRMELLGYRAEGVARMKFVKGHTRKNTILLSCLYEDYSALKKKRDGKYWLGEEGMFKLIKKMPRKGYADVLVEELQNLNATYFSPTKK